MPFRVDVRKLANRKEPDDAPLKRALERVESYSYEDLVAHIKNSRADGYTGEPLFTEELANDGHISAQVFFETDDDASDVRAMVAYSKRSLLSHLFPKSASVLIKPGHAAKE